MQNPHKPRALGRPKSLEKREQIMYCATKLLLSLGYKNTSMDAVAKESNVSKQTVYSHFKNKHALFNAVIESKCAKYQMDDASVSISTQPLLEILSTIGLSFIRLLNDENVISMYKVVIGESQQESSMAQLFYDAGPLHSVNLLTKILKAHPESLLNETDAYELSLDFFNLLKSDFHIRGILHLPYELSESSQKNLANKVAIKTVAIMAVVKNY
jgi:TetR/AcrR family transcriptional repressor of mexJK operon